MAKRSEAKRWAEWVTVFPRERPRRRRDAQWNTARYREDGHKGVRTVRVVEVRKGEVVVDVDSLRESLRGYMTADHTRLVGSMLRKVGVR